MTGRIARSCRDGNTWPGSQGADGSRNCRQAWVGSELHGRRKGSPPKEALEIHDRPRVDMSVQVLSQGLWRSYWARC